jgi:hypothetical protein
MALRLVLLLSIVILSVTGCVEPASTSILTPTLEPRPTISSNSATISNWPPALDKIKISYPELFQEMLKLPDLQRIDDKEREAIEDIVGLALDSKYKAAFESMLQEGSKNQRKYCTPLQALLWIALDRELELDSPLENYSLVNLVRVAWRDTTSSMNYTSARWQVLDEVVERLNSPMLVSIYMIDNITEDLEELHAFPHRFAPPADTFARKKGICNEQARFALYCLLGNGYDYDDFENYENTACMLGIDIDTPNGHDVCLLKEKGSYYTIDNGVLRGPFPNVVSAVDSTALRVNIAAWRKYFFRDLSLNQTKIVRVDQVERTAQDANNKGISINGVISDWPSAAVVISDPSGDVSNTTSGNGADLKAVSAVMDEDYLYIAIEVYGVFDLSLLRNYYVALSYSGEHREEYDFKVSTSGDIWFFDLIACRDSPKPEGALNVLAAIKGDTAKMRIPRKDYGIPKSVCGLCRVTEGGPNVDLTQWFTISQTEIR